MCSKLWFFYMRVTNLNRADLGHAFGCVSEENFNFKSDWTIDMHFPLAVNLIFEAGGDAYKIRWKDLRILHKF